jgi:hypothetical protein
MAKPTYHCKFHNLHQTIAGDWRMEMTVLSKHEASGAPAGSRGSSSSVQSIDFRNGVCITRNTVYVFEPQFTP